jgi:hypothetical protein
MPEATDQANEKDEPLIKEIIALERSYFFEKKNVKTERLRKLREIIERHTQAGAVNDDS